MSMATAVTVCAATALILSCVQMSRTVGVASEPSLRGNILERPEHYSVISRSHNRTENNVEAHITVCAAKDYPILFPWTVFIDQEWQNKSVHDLHITKDGRPFTFSPSTRSSHNGIELLTQRRDAGNWTIVHSPTGKTTRLDYHVFNARKLHQCPNFLSIYKSHAVTNNGTNNQTCISPTIPAHISVWLHWQKATITWYADKQGRLHDGEYISGAGTLSLCIRGENRADNYHLYVTTKEGQFYHRTTRVIYVETKTNMIGSTGETPTNSPTMTLPLSSIITESADQPKLITKTPEAQPTTPPSQTSTAIILEATTTTSPASDGADQTSFLTYNEIAKQTKPTTVTGNSSEVTDTDQALGKSSSPTNTSNSIGPYIAAIGVLGVLSVLGVPGVAYVIFNIFRPKQKEQNKTAGWYALPRNTASPTGHYQQPPVTTGETTNGLTRSDNHPMEYTADEAPLTSVIDVDNHSARTDTAADPDLSSPSFDNLSTSYSASESKAADRLLLDGNTPADSCATSISNKSLTRNSNSSAEVDVDNYSQGTHTMTDGTARRMNTLSTTGSSSAEKANSKPPSDENIHSLDYAVSDKSETIDPDRNMSTSPTSLIDVHKVLTCSSAMLPGTASGSVHTEQEQQPGQLYTLTEEFASTSHLDCSLDMTQTMVGGEAGPISTCHFSANCSLTEATDSEPVDKLSGSIQLCAAIGQNEVLGFPLEIAPTKVDWNPYCNALSEGVTDENMCNTLATQLGLVSDNPRNKLVKGLFIKRQNNPMAVATDLFRLWIYRTPSLSDDKRLHKLHEIFFEIVPTTLSQLGSDMDELLPKFLIPKL